MPAVANGFPAGGKVEILWDSGVHSNILPLSCGHVGHAICLDASSRFVDAQGAPLGVSDKRVAELVIGDAVIGEQFIVAPVTGPIVCLVKLLKAGLEFQRIDGVLLYLCKDGHGFPVYYRKNSLYNEVSFQKSHRYRMMVQRLHLEL